MPSLNIRAAVACDVPLILMFIHELAAYERAPEAVKATESDLLRDGFGEVPRFRCLIVESEHSPAGFALFFYNYSTWEGNAGIYLEDLFVRESFRGQGIGKALLLAVVKIAVAEGCSRLDWNVLKWNQSAIDFYQRLGAGILEDWSPCRLTRESMGKLSASLERP